jgi:hypothetical protein
LDLPGPRSGELRSLATSRSCQEARISGSPSGSRGPCRSAHRFRRYASYVPTPAEAELAVAWFECRSGYGTAGLFQPTMITHIP